MCQVFEVEFKAGQNTLQVERIKAKISLHIYTLFLNFLRWEIGVAFHVNMFEFQVASLDEIGCVVFEEKLYFLICKHVFAF